MLSYEEFKEKVIQDFTSYVGPEYENYVLNVQRVNKVNRILDGISLIHPDRHSQIVPTIYINDIYESYKKSENYEYEMTQAAKTMRVAMKKGETMLPPIDYKKAENKIVYQIISTRDNSSFLKEVPHREILDMSIIYRWIVNVDSKGISSVVVHNELAEAMGLDENDLYKMACKNTARILPVSIDSMSNILRNRAIANGFMDDNSDSNDTGMDFDNKFLIMTNTSGFMGASTMLYDGVLDEVSKKVGGNFYIVPSSINELIIIADDGVISADVLLGMVIDINRNELDTSEKLTDNVYYYDAENKMTTSVAMNSAM